MVVGLHGFDLAEGFRDVAADISDPVLTEARKVAHPATENQDGGDDQWQGYDHDAGEFGIGDK
ncbi:hypothetical protein D3C84_1028590 [compost metagenome]